MSGANAVVSFSKDPDAVLDYVMDWTNWLNGDIIISSSWTLDAGITQAGTGMSGTQTVVWLSGGTVGTSYQITNRITTQAGRTEDRTFQVNVVQR